MTNESKKSQPKFKNSKEFQIKIVRDVGESDEDCLGLVKEILKDLEDLGLISDLTPPKDGWGRKGSWQRHGERYDTESGLFRSNRISLATEKSNKDGEEQTKVKCKLHNFVPELLYPMPKDSSSIEDAYCYPSLDDPDIKTKFKLEQDIHFNNCKYCATGYFELPGRDHKFRRVGDFFERYPNLAKLTELKPKTPLQLVKDWSELVFDDIEMEIGGKKVKSALVTRRERIGGAWVESELSFKVEEPKKGWDHHALADLARVYNSLYKQYAGRYFIADPSIFFFHAPV